MADEARPCILLVDDHEDALRVMALLLERSGYAVKKAHNYEEAVDLIEGQRCELLISDVVLEDKSGLDLIRDLKPRYNLKSIAISSYVGSECQAKALLAGFDRFIPKPFDFGQLLILIEELSERAVA